RHTPQFGKGHLVEAHGVDSGEERRFFRNKRIIAHLAAQARSDRPKKYVAPPASPDTQVLVNKSLGIDREKMYEPLLKENWTSSIICLKLEVSECYFPRLRRLRGAP